MSTGVGSWLQTAGRRLLDTAAYLHSWGTACSCLQLLPPAELPCPWPLCAHQLLEVGQLNTHIGQAHHKHDAPPQERERRQQVQPAEGVPLRRPGAWVRRRVRLAALHLLN